MRLLVLACVAALLAGCGATGPGSPAPASLTPSDVAAPSASPSAVTASSGSPAASGGILELTAGPALLPAGTYRYSPFQPALTLALTGEWTSVSRFDDFFDVERDVESPDVIAVQFARPRQLIGKTKVDTPKKPADAVKILKANPLLDIVDQSDSKIGGLSGNVIQVENTSGQHAGVMVLGAGELGIDSARKLWIAFFPTSEGLIAVMIGGSVAKWQDALDAAEPVLESIRFTTP